MDAQQFREQYSASSGMTPAEFDQFYVALPCDCDSPNCKGWAAVFNNPQSIKTHMEIYAPEPDHIRDRIADDDARSNFRGER